MSSVNDVIAGHGFAYQVKVGITESERSVPQKIVIHFEARYRPRSGGWPDTAESIVIDYFAVNQLFAEFLASRSFHLIETIGDELSRLLLHHYKIDAVTVTVCKFPAGMPNIESVSYRCERKR